MSDNWIVLIPEDPHHVPYPARQTRARDRLAEIARHAEEIEIKVSEGIEFFDCGENLERILCPSCGSEIPNDWWEDRLDDDAADEGFQLAKYTTPCCQSEHTLNELIYQWPQGFARFALDATNPDIGKLEDQQKQEFEDILGTPLRVIY